MKNSQIVGFAVVIIAVVALLVVIAVKNDDTITEPAALVTSFSECVEAGFTLSSSTPATCITPLGVTFVSVDTTDTTTLATSTAPVIKEPKPVIIPNKGTGPVINRDVPPISPTGSPFGHPENYTPDSRKFYNDGLVVTLVSITSSLCPPDVACIWAGELTTTLSVHGGTLGNTPHTIVLSTLQTPTVTLENYTFTLSSASVSLATIIVSN